MSDPVPSAKTQRRYDVRSYMAAAGYVKAVVDFQDEVKARGYVSLDEIAELTHAGESMNRAHYYGGTRLHMEFTYNGQTYNIESHEDEGTFFG